MNKAIRQLASACMSGALTLGGALGCTSLNAIRVDAFGTSAEKPSNVAVYLAVSDGDRPVTGLDAESFSIFENGQPLAPDDIHQTLLDRRGSAEHRTLLLIDVSAATPETVRHELNSAEELFVETVRKTQPVSVYVFDGGTDIRLLAEVDRETKPTKLGAALAPVPKDTSRNLNGAIVQAADQLHDRLARSPAPIRVGTLVVFAGGADLAGRVHDDTVLTRLDQASYTVFAIGIGDTAPLLRRVGKDGFVDAHSADTISLAFEDAAHRVAALYGKYYLLSYCSPARAQQRTLRVEVKVTSPDGTPRAGALTTQFDAEGFGPNCDPQKRPHFATATQ